MAENKNAKTPADDGQPVAWMHNFIEKLDCDGAAEFFRRYQSKG
jgi:hypothetical protein